MTSTDDYLPWLYEQVGLPRIARNRSYWRLFEQMYSREFVWVDTKDQARSGDGLDLRWRFVEAARLPRVPAPWLYDCCSVLEMIVALSLRMESIAGKDPRTWFTAMITNLGLASYVDISYDKATELSVEHTLNHLVWRTYLPNGDGGLFPLKNPTKDQRKTEIWYQMNSWLMENSVI